MINFRVEGHHTSSQNRIMVSDEDGTLTPLCPDNEPLLTSAKIALNGIIVEKYFLPPFEFPERFSDAHHVSLHLSSPTRLEWFVAGREQSPRLTRGSINFFPQGIRPRVRCQDETEFLMLALDPSVVEQVATLSGKTNRFELIMQLGIRDLQIEHICLALKAELETGNPSGRIYGESLAVALAAHLLGKYAAPVPNTGSRSAGLPAYKLRRVLDYINANLTKDLSLGEITHVAGMNPHYFSRAFKQSTGIPPHRYVINCRVQTAKRLLMNDKLPLVEVGLRVGFQNQSHFITLFHKLTGMTPKAYRDRNS